MRQIKEMQIAIMSAANKEHETTVMSSENKESETTVIAEGVIKKYYEGNVGVTRIIQTSFLINKVDASDKNIKKLVCQKLVPDASWIIDKNKIEYTVY